MSSEKQRVTMAAEYVEDGGRIKDAAERFNVSVVKIQARIDYWNSKEGVAEMESMDGDGSFN